MNVWMSPRKARNECGISAAMLSRLIKQGLVSVRQLPGGRPQVNVAELKEIVEQSTRRRAQTVGMEA